MFLHGGFLHVGGNMLFLWIFGDNVEDRMGHGRFLRLLPAVRHCCRARADADAARLAIADGGCQRRRGRGDGRLFRALSQLADRHLSSSSSQFIEVPAIVFLGLWFVLQFVSGVGSVAASAGQTGGIAFWAHVAGFAAGVIGVFLFRRPERQRVEWWDDVR